MCWWLYEGADVSGFKIIEEKNEFTAWENSYKTIEQSLLPEADACFEILTRQMKLFVQEFDDEFFSAKYFSESNKKADLRELKTRYGSL